MSDSQFSNNQIPNKSMIAFLFDTGEIAEAFYGNTVFGNFIEGMEITSNKYKTVFSEGDILDRSIYSDINPFLIRDNLCSVLKNQENFKGELCALLVEDIETEIAIAIDSRMKTNFSAYIGMTSVDAQSTDRRKQFWKSLIRTFSIEYMTITSFHSVEEGTFNYFETATAKGFHVICDGFEDGSLFSTRQSSFVNNAKQLNLLDGKNDADRGILNMNFSLVKEVCIAGVQIWKSIEDIANTHISKDDNAPFALGQVPTEYIFTSLYQASQGIERLLKVILELIMYGMEENAEKEKIKNLLIGHNHPSMWDYIESKENIKSPPLNKKLLNVLCDFYNRARYYRYKDGGTDVLELKLLQIFGKDLAVNDFDQKIKHLYGKALGQTAQYLYKTIYNISSRLNVYVYELPCDSTACYALNSYYGEDLYATLERITLSKKELLWYLINNGKDHSSTQFAKDYSPLPFEKCDITNFVKDFLCCGHSNYDLFNFVDNEYDELVSDNKPNWKERTDAIDTLVGNTDIYFDVGEEADVECD
ncbi:MAG: hypothetical protein RR444_01895 [Oscillospiraceae bacterium]